MAGGSDRVDWIAGSTIEASASGLDFFSGSMQIDTSGLPDPPDEPDRFLVYRLGDHERQLELGPLPIPIDRWWPWWHWT